MSKPRSFDFDRETTLPDAIRAIVAALDDEGLALTDSDNSMHGHITSVLVDGVKRVIVPSHRIVRKGGAPLLEIVR